MGSPSSKTLLRVPPARVSVLGSSTQVSPGPRLCHAPGEASCPLHWFLVLPAGADKWFL